MTKLTLKQSVCVSYYKMKRTAFILTLHASCLENYDDSFRLGLSS